MNGIDLKFERQKTLAPSSASSELSYITAPFPF